MRTIGLRTKRFEKHHSLRVTLRIRFMSFAQAKQDKR